MDMICEQRRKFRENKNKKDTSTSNQKETVDIIGKAESENLICTGNIEDKKNKGKRRITVANELV